MIEAMDLVYEHQLTNVDKQVLEYIGRTYYLYTVAPDTAKKEIVLNSANIYLESTIKQLKSLVLKLN
jgi:hypothetical protein